ncbi:hypothetical protein [Paenibacillus wynnii]|uniref:hypothetical protein n=1 Tax=Paenibacillus wynnii TaxID=268407 RepID=UPI002793A316|nr:hypothetical protein [Paenibacillus wynnii]MDQ0193382.1 hypothetical protein [Paenibacillus wynnii]
MNNNEITIPVQTTSEMLKNTIFNLVEGITGIATSEKNELILSAGHLVQRLRSTSLLNALREEWNLFRERGKIADDYQYTEQHINCLQETLEFLDKDIPDEIRFSMLKKLLLVAAQEILTDRNSHLPIQMIKMCKTMSSGESLVLLTTYSIAKSGGLNNERFGAIKWLEYVADHSGLVFPELVETYEQELVKKHLLTDRVHPDNSGVNLGENFRLTGFGHMLCSYIEKYDEENKQFGSIS